jgi:asparagine synthase (glutamine-hydrolysing)
LPGIFGLCDFSQKIDLPSQTGSIKRILCYNSFFDWQSHLDEGIVLGRVGLGSKPEQYIAVSGEGTSLVIHGQIFNLDELNRNAFKGTPAEKLLMLYDQAGEKIVPQLKGSFALAIRDKRKRTLFLANDRFGTRPLYYFQSRGIFAFCSETKLFLALSQFGRKINLQALAELFSFGLVLEEKTLLEGISLLPPGSVMKVTIDKVESNKYWKPRFCDSNRRFQKKDALEECSALLSNSVERNLRTISSPGLFLSGGLDSRILAALAVNNSQDLQTFTFGTPDSQDVHLAEQLAEHLRLRHHLFPLRPDFLVHWLERGVWYTEGMSNCLNFAGIEVLPTVRRISSYVMNGYGGNEFLGFLSGNLAKYYYWGSQSRLANRFYRDLNTLFREEELYQLLNPNLVKEIKGAAYESLQGILKNCEEKIPFAKLYNFLLTQKARRLNLLGIIMDHSHLEYSLPFYDYDFAEFALALPPQERLWAKFYRHFLSKKFPTLAEIPYQRSGLPVNANLAIVMSKKISDRLGIRLLGRKLFSYTPAYVDYPGWTRKELKGFILNVLDKDRMAGQAWFNYQQISRLLDEHFNGLKEHSAKIGLLLTLEIWQRQFLEGHYPG